MILRLVLALVLAGCGGAKVRPDSAPSPVDINHHTVLLETDCNGVQRTGFGQAGCSWTPEETPAGTLTVHTPLPGSIQAVGRDCGVDETQFHPEKGGSFKFDLSRWAKKMDTRATEFCRVNLFVRWQLPQGMTSEYVLKGMTGRVYLRRTRPGSHRPRFQWIPEAGGLGEQNGIAWSQFRAMSATDLQTASEPLRLVIDLPSPVVRGKYRLWGCSHGEPGADFQGGRITVGRDVLLGSQSQAGACDLFGYAVGVLEDGSTYDADLVVPYEVFRADAQKLATNVRLEGDQVCYDTENTVSLAVLNHGDENQASNKLSDCFKLPADGKARLGFFTHQGRAVYAVIEGGTITYLQ